MKIRHLFILPLFVFFACGGTTTTENTETEQTTDSTAETETKSEQENTETTNENSDYLIEETKFFGVEVGKNIEDILAEKPDLLKKGMYQSGEGDFEIYQILDSDGGSLADVFFFEEKGKKKITSIVVTSEKAATLKEIKVGSTYDEVMKAYPKAEVHGSEIEGYTHAFIGGFAFKLDVNIWTEEVKEKIAPETKVIAIDIRGKQ
jgi:hypothetical protein